MCRDLCRSKKDKEKAKKEKKDKHGAAAGKEDAKNSKHKMKNVHTYTMIGQGKKNTDQDSASMFEMLEEGTLVRFYGVYDGHGDFGKEVTFLQ